ncbi:MAG: PAS domain S-box protein [Magnetococcales bacterium]|nr:PAS domain S-box protein [Magnetococcales bacterium]
MRFRDIKKHVTGASVMGLAATLCLLTLLWSVDAAEREKYQLQNHKQMRDIVGAVRANLEASINRRIHLLQGLSAFVIANPHFDENEFQAFVRELGSGLDGVRSLQLAPKAVVTHIHPLQGNEAAKGHDLLNDPQRHDAVQKAIDAKKLILAGPVELRQGGKALIGRLPIFLNDAKDGTSFWGLAIMVIDFTPLLQESRLFDPSPYMEIALRGKDGLGARGALFFGPESAFQDDAVTQEITLPNGSWQVAARPRHGWPTDWPGRALFLALGGVLSLLVGVAIHHLIRKPQRLQQALDEGELQLRALSTAIRSVATAVVITNRDGVIEWVNPAFSEETGYTPEEIIGRTHAVLKSGLQPAAFYRELWETILAGRTWRGEFTNRHKKGHLYVEESVITPVMDKDNQIERFIAIKQDVTRRRQAETALKASHLRFRSLIQSASDAIIIANQEGRIETWNRGAREMFGYEEEEVHDHPLEFIIPPEYRERHRARLAGFDMRDTTDMRLTRITRELSGLRKSGETFPVELSLSHWKLGESHYHLAIIRDLTARKQTERQLKEYAEKLETMVEERTRQLLHTERLATLGTFAAGIGHEIKNPNSFITGNIAFLRQFWSQAAPLLEQAAATDPKGRVARFLTEVQPALEGIEKGSQRITTIIDSLKSYASGNRETGKRAVALREPLREARTLLQHRLKHGVRLEESLPEDLTLTCNAQEISQVFINLFTNAMDAMEEHGVTDRFIEVEGRWEGDGVRIVVRDNGPGIPKESRARIFEPFVTTKGPTRGTGLGLSIVKGIVEGHLGRISLLDDGGPGAGFLIEFPGPTAPPTG